MYSIHCDSEFASRFWWCAPDKLWHGHFRLEMQETACRSKTFRRKKVQLPNGLFLHTAWYTLPKIDPPAGDWIRRGVRDVTLPNGIALRATRYRPYAAR